MARFAGSILLDNNAIGAAVDNAVWKGLLGSYAGQLETVELVEGEAGSYFRGLAGSAALMKSLAKLKVHGVSKEERASLAVRLEGLSMDEGEEDLWAHAHMRKDSWILCGPDKASFRAAIRLGLRDRLVSLEELLIDAGLSTKGLKDQYTKAFLNRVVSHFIMEEFEL